MQNLSIIRKDFQAVEQPLGYQFKAVTAMSPLQYQKRLRLHEARRLMLSEGLDAASAGFRVGYESPAWLSSRWSRVYPRRAEYRRNHSPRLDAVLQGPNPLKEKRK